MSDDEERELLVGDKVLFYYKHQSITGTVRAIKVRRLLPTKCLLDWAVRVTWDTPGDMGTYRRTRWVRERRVLYRQLPVEASQ